MDAYIYYNLKDLKILNEVSRPVKDITTLLKIRSTMSHIKFQIYNLIDGNMNNLNNPVPDLSVYDLISTNFISSPSFDAFMEATAIFWDVFGDGVRHLYPNIRINKNEVGGIIKYHGWDIEDELIKLVKVKGWINR